MDKHFRELYNEVFFQQRNNISQDFRKIEHLLLCCLFRLLI